MIDSLMDGAEAHYQQMVKKGEWEQRNLIWLRSELSSTQDTESQSVALQF